jgi:hypothetical protein
MALTDSTESRIATLEAQIRTLMAKQDDLQKQVDGQSKTLISRAAGTDPGPTPQPDWAPAFAGDIPSGPYMPNMPASPFFVGTSIPTSPGASSGHFGGPAGGPTGVDDFEFPSHHPPHGFENFSDIFHSPHWPHSILPGPSPIARSNTQNEAVIGDPGNINGIAGGFNDIPGIAMKEAPALPPANSDPRGNIAEGDQAADGERAFDMVPAADTAVTADVRDGPKSLSSTCDENPAAPLEQLQISPPNLPDQREMGRETGSVSGDPVGTLEGSEGGASGSNATPIISAGDSDGPDGGASKVCSSPAPGVNEAHPNNLFPVADAGLPVGDDALHSAAENETPLPVPPPSLVINTLPITQADSQGMDGMMEGVARALP